MASTCKGPPRTRSTDGERREAVLGAAIRVFSVTGYHATPVSSVATAAGISEGYLVQLSGDKQALFTAALARCFERIRDALEAVADEVAGARLGG